MTHIMQTARKRAATAAAPVTPAALVRDETGRPASVAPDVHVPHEWGAISGAARDTLRRSTEDDEQAAEPGDNVIPNAIRELPLLLGGIPGVRKWTNNRVDDSTKMMDDASDAIFGPDDKETQRKPLAYPVLPRLTVGAVDDPAEAEADRVAEAALSGPLEDVPYLPDMTSVQRRAESAPTEDEADVEPLVSRGMSGGGQPLPDAVRADMEPRFNHDFSNVRVHTDSHASESASALNAQAYAVGSDIVFGGGKFAPTTGDGRNLLAHELVHVMQQTGPSESVQRRPSRKNEAQLGQVEEVEEDVYEEEAEPASLQPAGQALPAGCLVQEVYLAPLYTAVGDTVPLYARQAAVQKAQEAVPLDALMAQDGLSKLLMNGSIPAFKIEQKDVETPGGTGDWDATVQVKAKRQSTQMIANGGGSRIVRNEKHTNGTSKEVENTVGRTSEWNVNGEIGAGAEASVEAGPRKKGLGVGAGVNADAKIGGGYKRGKSQTDRTLNGTQQSVEKIIAQDVAAVTFQVVMEFEVEVEWHFDPSFASSAYNLFSSRREQVDKGGKPVKRTLTVGAVVDVPRTLCAEGE